MLEAGTPDEALALYRQIQAEVPDNEVAIAGVIRASLAIGDREAADKIIATLPMELKNKPEIAAAVSAVELDKAAEGAGDISHCAKKWMRIRKAQKPGSTWRWACSQSGNMNWPLMSFSN